MNLDDLRRAKNRERETDSLQELPDSFYADVAEYIRERKATRADLAETVDDPFSSEDITRLSDEIETAEQIAESLYERRVGKVVKQASFAAADMGGGEEGNLTAEERDLYRDLVDRITQNKHRVLDVIAGDTDATAHTEPNDDAERPSSAPPSSPEAESESGVDAADLMGDGDDAGDDDAGQKDGADDARTTVRITRDVGEIFGVDQRTYTLETDDVVTLPDENAAPLVKQDAAEPLE
ncbi:MAG: hypothetical protein ABEJ68_05550 [Halobacteriaceae archaeon]